VTMNLIVGQDGILQLVGNENGSPQVPRRDDESEHQEGRKELQGRFSRNRFEVCEEKIVARCDIDQSRILSIREAVSLGGGRRFIKCNCSGNRRKCGTKTTSNATVGATTACLVQINEAKEQIILCQFGFGFLHSRCWGVLTLLVRTFFCFLFFIIFISACCPK